MPSPEKPCAKCGQPISAEQDRFGCPNCENAFHTACMPKPGACPNCERERREADRHFTRNVVPIVQKRAKRLWVFTIGLSVVFAAHMARPMPQETPIPRWLGPLVALVTLVGIYLIESRCPYCRSLIFLLHPPRQCSRCGGRLV